MPPPKQARPRRKDIFAEEFKKLGKPVLFSESIGRPSSLAPNIRSLSWSPTGNAIASSLYTSIRIWNPDKASVKQSIELRGAPGAGVVEKVGFCPTHEAVLASTGADGFCRLWDVRLPSGAAVAGRGTKFAEAQVGDVGLFLTWHPSGSQLLVGRKDDVVQLVDVRQMVSQGTEPLWDTSVSDSTPSKNGHGQLNAMAFSNSGKQLFVTTGDGPVDILDWPSLALLHTLDGHSSATNAVQQSPAGTFVAAGGTDGIVTIWDTLDWNCMHAVTTHSGAVRDLSFSFDGAYLVVAGGMDARDGSSGIRVTHVESGDNIVNIDTQNPVTWAAWHPLRYWLAYAGDPGGLKILGAGVTFL